MIGDSDVLVGTVRCGIRHFRDCAGSIAPPSVHLQIAAQLLCPGRSRREEASCLGEGEKIVANCRYCFRAVRLLHPLLNLFLDKRADAAQFGQRPVLRDKIRYFFRPQKRAARGLAKRARKNSSLAFRLLSKQLRNVSVR